MSDIQEIDSERLDAESSPATFEVAVWPADFTLQVLHDKWKQGQIRIPVFQRHFVWSQAQASRLIESFLLGLPVPSVFLYSDKETEDLLVIDGQQRLQSIFYYLEGHFGPPLKGKKTIFRLTELNEGSPWAGKNFEDLQSSDAKSSRRLLNSVMRSIIIKQMDPKDDTSIYHIFERLNTGGTLLKGQEIRNCVYNGVLNDLLRELNDIPEWRVIFGKRDPDKRMRDIELILRFLALHACSSIYTKPMKDFLSAYMKHHRNPPEAHLSDMRSLFTSTVATVRARLGPKPFHIFAGINAAVYDCVMVTVAKHLPRVGEDFRARYEVLKRDPTFLLAISAGTTDEDVVQGRLAIAERVLID